jgi:hypothetical protein
VGGQHHAPAAFTPGKDLVPIVQKVEWASEPVWIGAENLALAGIQSPDFPARSKSLYRLRHPGSYTIHKFFLFEVFSFLFQGIHNEKRGSLICLSYL